MKKLWLIGLIFSVQLMAIDKTISIGYEINYGYSKPGPYSFNDEQSHWGVSGEIAENWLGNINRGNFTNGNIVLKLPFGILPYWGFYLAQFFEKNYNIDVINQRFGLGSFEFSPEMKFAINQIHGYCYGVRLRFTELFEWPINPFIAYESYKNTFESNYGMMAENIQYKNPDHGVMPDNILEVENTITTKSIKNSMLYFGLELDLGDFTITGAVKNYEDWSHITNRLGGSRHFFDGYRNSGMEYNLKVPDSHKIKYDRKEYSLGIRYNIPVISLDHDNNNRKVVSPLEGFSIEINPHYSAISRNSLYKKAKVFYNGFVREKDDPLKLINNGFGFNANLLYNRFPWFQPYIGVNITKYNYNKEQAEVDSKAVVNIYQGLSGSTIWKIREYNFYYINRGFQVGGYVSLSNPNNQIIPVLQVEGLMNQFSLYGTIRAEMQDLNPEIFDEETTGLYKGEITNNLLWRFGYGIGIGLRYRIGKINIKPLAKFNKLFKGQPIWDYDASIESLDTGDELWEKIDEVHYREMNIKYYTFGVGLEYDL